eukprot:scaffold1947_cov241-Skeletonema_marinoi.AAC.2
MTTKASRLCVICTNDYGGRIVPAMLTCCMNHVCYDCAESDRSRKITDLEGNRKLIRCIFCNQKYHCSKETPWKVNNHFIEESGIDVDLTFVRETQAAMTAGVTNNQRKGPRRRPETSSLNNAADNSNVVRQKVTRSSGRGDGEDGEDTEVELIDLSNNQDSPSIALTNRDAGTNLRRSQRTRRPTERNLADEMQSSNDDITTNTRQSKRSRIVELEVALSDEAGDQQWREVIAKDNADVYRIRCYNNDSKTEGDKFSRRISEWCVKNGIMITELELAKLLPRCQWFDGEALKMKVASIDSNQELRHICDECNDFNPKERTYIGSYRQFVEMKKGDIIVLHTKGGYTKGGPPQTLSFGVIEDDSLTTMTKEEATQRQCPLDLSGLCDSNSPGGPAARIGFMVKKVKWLRHGELKAVRGPRQVSWLVEASPLWLMKVGTLDQNILRNAISKMGSEQFMRNTHSIDNQWTMG